MIPQQQIDKITQQFSSTYPVASGLSAYAYTSEDYWRQEQQTLFA